MRLELHSIHEALLGAVKDDDGEEHSDAEDYGAIDEAAGIEGADAKATVLEGLEDWGEWVEVDDPAVFLWGEGEWIDYWGGVHEELDAELDEELQVAVFCCP